MTFLKHFTAWLPHSLRRQFMFAISALTLLIAGGGSMAVYTLHTSATTIHTLAEHRLVQMQKDQALVQLTLLIERKSYQLAQAESQEQLHANYREILGQLSKFDDVVDQLAAESEGNTLLELFVKKSCNRIENTHYRARSNRNNIIFKNCTNKQRS